LTSGTAFDALPSWSADGARVAFTSTRGGQVHIYLMNADGGTLAPLTSGPAVDASPSWRAAE
jgi:TolB protein